MSSAFVVVINETIFAAAQRRIASCCAVVNSLAGIAGRTDRLPESRVVLPAQGQLTLVCTSRQRRPSIAAASVAASICRCVSRTKPKSITNAPSAMRANIITATSTSTYPPRAARATSWHTSDCRGSCSRGGRRIFGCCCPRALWGSRPPRRRYRQDSARPRRFAGIEIGLPLGAVHRFDHSQFSPTDEIR